MTTFDRSKKKAIIFQGRTTGRETKYANPYYEGTEGWSNVHYFRKHFIITLPSTSARRARLPTAASPATAFPPPTMRYHDLPPSACSGSLRW